MNSRGSDSPAGADQRAAAHRGARQVAPTTMDDVVRRILGGGGLTVELAGLPSFPAFIPLVEAIAEIYARTGISRELLTRGLAVTEAGELHVAADEVRLARVDTVQRRIQIVCLLTLMLDQRPGAARRRGASR